MTVRVAKRPGSGPVAQAGVIGEGGGGHWKQRGKCRECREERADDNTAGQQADYAGKGGPLGGKGEAEAAGERTAEGAQETSASTTARGASARTAGAPASASISASGAIARTGGAPASASITARGAPARTAGAPASVSITASGANARTAGAPASACIPPKEYLQECGGASICQHNRIKSQCKDCGGASICQFEHNCQVRRELRRTIDVHGVPQGSKKSKMPASHTSMSVMMMIDGDDFANLVPVRRGDVCEGVRREESGQHEERRRGVDGVDVTDGFWVRDYGGGVRVGRPVGAR